MPLTLPNVNSPRARTHRVTRRLGTSTGAHGHEQSAGRLRPTEPWTGSHARAAAEEPGQVVPFPGDSAARPHWATALDFAVLASPGRLSAIRILIACAGRLIECSRTRAVAVSRSRQTQRNGDASPSIMRYRSERYGSDRIELLFFLAPSR